ncbi:MAG TPA: PEP-utilizing enzyme, partial [Roseiflexaceae bacterium]
LDRMHFPEPITPMTGVFIRLLGDATNPALQAYAMPVQLAVRRINTYHYQAGVPIVAPPEEMQRRAARSQATIEAAMASLAERWANEWLPEVQRHLAAWEAFDLRGASLPALLAHLDDTIVRYIWIFEVHALVNIPSLAAMDAFNDLYQRLFGDESALSAYRLLQGFDNKTLEAGRALWRLSRQALEAPEVRAVLEQRAPAELPAALEPFPAGRAFLTALQDYLEAYGKRSNAYFELANPAWIEEPTPVIKNLKDYVAQPDRDLEAERAVLAAERERCIAEARERLQGQPHEAINRFEFLLKAAQAGTILMEDHGFWIDSRTIYEVRRVLLEFGRRFADMGVMDQPADVFFLTIDELRETAAALSERGRAPLSTVSRGKSGERRRLIAGRQAELAYFRTITPPDALGTPRPAADERAAAGRGAKFFGRSPATQAAADVVQGSAGAAGKAQGPARVIYSLDQAGKLHKGDILVAPTTSPPWTPLFATAAAVVTDTGGVLSHCAIVAREYGIPAVVGTGNATTVIRDGQLLEVDGSAGIVRILDGDDRQGSV